MKSFWFLNIALNFLAVVLLISLIALPFYFSRKVAQVAGVKSEAKYLLISQVDKFPNLGLSQTGSDYRISYEKQADSQLFESVFILNNPTSSTKTYDIDSYGVGKLFFGEDPENQISEISVPSSVSVPISLISENRESSQFVEFKILVK